MDIKKVVTGTVAALSSVAALGALAVAPAYAQDGLDVAALSQHGGAQRIAAIGNTRAKNVILFIGDGMGDSEITIARNYLHGVNGRLDGIDTIGQPGSAPETGVGQYTTFSLGSSSNDSLMAKDKDGKLAGSKTAGVITPVTDSSASGSGWSTGTKTYNNAVDVDVKGNPQLNLIELAKARGLATGNVTTAEIQDATPAVLESHSTERACYGPQGKWDGKTDTNKDGKIDASDGAAEAAKRCLANQLKANGGIGSISEQLLDTRADVTIGGGSKYFNQLGLDGKTLWQQAKDRGFQTVQSGDIAGFKALNSADQTKPVLALLGDGNLPTKFNPSVATKYSADKDEHPTVCTPNSKWLGNQGASLADFTNKAIDLLSKNPNGANNGYFLQVEGASIDKQDHNANACGQIGETDDLDKAVSAALKKVDLNNTLILVTADHAHTSQIVESQPYYALSTVLKNADGSKTTISYGTSDAPVYQNEDGDPIDNDEYVQGSNGDKNTEEKFDGAMGNMSHTGTQLRLAASGPGSARVDGLTDQTDNFYTIAYALGLAANTNAQNDLSNGAAVALKADKGAVRAEATGFNGDAVLSYKVTDKKTKKVVDQSNDSTPVSGVRVATTQTTVFPLNNLAAGSAYTLTVAGRQSGRSVSYDFTAPAKTVTGDVKADAQQNGVPTFADVNDKTPHAEDIVWLAQRGISTGWKAADGTVTFRGQNAVVRQDMAAFLYRLAGSPKFDESKAKNPFSDVTKNTPHYKEVLWLASTGISTGWKKDGKVEFRGDQAVVRQDMAAFLQRLAKYQKANPALGKDVAFADVNDKTPHAEDISWLAKTGVTTGWTEADGTVTFRGQLPVVRQDMAAFLHRMSDNVLR